MLLALAYVVTATARTASIEGSVMAVEDDGADCAVTLPGSSNASSTLPDPFTRLNGTRIATRSDWRCRREEIEQLAERSVCGAKPAKPASVTGTVSSTDITVNVAQNGRSASFSAGVQLPSGPGPFPAVVVIGGLGADTATILGSGAAVISYNPLAVGQEGTARNDKQGAFYTIYGSTSSTGLLIAWAWGVSRIIDVIEQSGGVLEAGSLGVTGCSRFGKGAFVTGAFRPAHRSDHADRVGQRRGAHAPRHSRRIGGPAAEQRLQRAAVAGRRVQPLHRQPDHAARGHASRTAPTARSGRNGGRPCSRTSRSSC